MSRNPLVAKALTGRTGPHTVLPMNEPDLDTAATKPDAAGPQRDAAGPQRDAAGPQRDAAAPQREAELAEKLAQVAAYEHSIRPGPLTAVMRRLGTTRGFAAVYRRLGPKVDPYIAKIGDGKVLARVYGFQVVLLQTIGAKSGQRRVSPLLYQRDGTDVILLGTNFGQPKHPGWTANLLAHPDAAITIGPVQLDVQAQLADDETWARIFPEFVRIYPGYEKYLDRRGDLTPRMFRLRPVG